MLLCHWARQLTYLAFWWWSEGLVAPLFASLASVSVTPFFFFFMLNQTEPNQHYVLKILFELLRSELICLKKELNSSLSAEIPQYVYSIVLIHCLSKSVILNCKVEINLWNFTKCYIYFSDILYVGCSYIDTVDFTFFMFFHTTQQACEKNCSHELFPQWDIMFLVPFTKTSLVSCFTLTVRRSWEVSPCNQKWQRKVLISS